MANKPMRAGRKSISVTILAPEGVCENEAERLYVTASDKKQHEIATGYLATTRGYCVAISPENRGVCGKIIKRVTLESTESGPPQRYTHAGLEDMEVVPLRYFAPRPRLCRQLELLMSELTAIAIETEALSIAVFLRCGHRCWFRGSRSRSDRSRLMLRGAATHDTQYQGYSNGGKKGLIQFVHLTPPFFSWF